MPSKYGSARICADQGTYSLSSFCKGVVVAQSHQKGTVAYWLGATFSAVGSGSVVGFCLQEWFGAHRFETWRESYIWIYWIMVLSTVAGALIGLYSYSYHRKREGW